MKKYYVEIPIAGYYSMEIEAPCEESAIDQALSYEWLKTIDVANDVELDELESYRHLIEGNVCHVWHSEAFAEEIESDDE